MPVLEDCDTVVAVAGEDVEVVKAPEVVALVVDTPGKAVVAEFSERQKNVLNPIGGVKPRSNRRVSRLTIRKIFEICYKLRRRVILADAAHAAIQSLQSGRAAETFGLRARWILHIRR